MHNKIGYLFIVIAALLLAISGTASKFIFSSGISPIELVQFRAAGSAILLVFVLGIQKPSLLKIVTKNIGYFVLLGTLLASTQFTYLFAISKTLVAVAILLQYQAPTTRCPLYVFCFAGKTFLDSNYVPHLLPTRLLPCCWCLQP